MRFAFLILLAFVPNLSAAPALGPDHRGSLEALRQAAEVLEKMERDTEDRIKLWCDVAALRQKLGDPDGASAAIRRAWEITDKCDDKDPGRKWRTVIVGYARLGETKRALELAALQPERFEKYNTYPRREALKEAVAEATIAGHFKCAASCAEAILDEADRKELTELVRRRVIVARFKTGDVVGARQALKELPDHRQKILTLVGEPLRRIWIGDGEPVDGIAGAQWRAGDRIGAKNSAFQALDLIRPGDGELRWQTALFAIRILSRLDDIAEARTVLSDYLPVESGKNREITLTTWYSLLARGYIGFAEVRAGRNEAALALLNNDEPKGLQLFFLNAIALAQAKVGRKEESKATFAKAIRILDDNKAGQESVSETVIAQAQSGDIDGAVATSKRFYCHGCETEIVLAQAQSGDFNAARKIAFDIWGEPAERSLKYANLMRQIARMQAAAGQSIAVREWAAKPHEYLTRASILIGLAEGLCQKQAKPGGK